MKTSPLTRRKFVKSAAVAADAAACSGKSYSAVAGANERVRLGVVGFGLMGRVHARSFHALPNARIVAVADTYQPHLEAARMLAGSEAAYHRDFRRVLEDKNVDAVVVATPDHWHALMTMTERFRMCKTLSSSIPAFQPWCRSANSPRAELGTKS